MTRQPFNPDLIRPPQDGATGPAKGPLTVTQVTALVKRAIETAVPATVHVLGEISNFKRHGSGHLYFTLKDRSSELSCVMWRSAAGKLKFDPDDGLEIVATGSIEVFERAGRYQLYVRKMEPRGVGALELAFRQLCEKLEGEGLFDASHKKPLPEFPRRVALVTSGTGAALRDMLQTMQRRYPCVDVLVYPVRVQGPGAAEEIAAAVRRIDEAADELGGIDLMIVGRGGGSLEDLWAFNEEVLARAIFACRTPIISAVGHEVDVTVADLVADVRAATPTAGAELAVPVLQDVLADVTAIGGRVSRALHAQVAVASARLDAIERDRAFREPLAVVHRREQVVDEVAGRLRERAVGRLPAARRRVDRAERSVQRIAPHAYLREMGARLRDAEHRLAWAVGDALAHAERNALGLRHRLDRHAPATRLSQLAEHIERLSERVGSGAGHRLALAGRRVAGTEQLLEAMSHKHVLSRGFSITRLKKGGGVVRSVGALKDRDRIVTELADGTVESDVVNLEQLELFD